MLDSLIAKLAARTVPQVLRAAGTARVQPLALTTTPNGMGGTRKAYGPAGDPLDCVYEILTPESAEQRVGEQPKGVLVYAITVRGDAGVTAKQRVRLLAHGAAPERELEVLHVAEPSGLTKLVYAAFEEAA